MILAGASLAQTRGAALRALMMDGTRRLAYPQYWYRVPLEFAAWYEEAFGLPELEDWYEEAFGREMAAQIRWHIHMMRMLWALERLQNALLEYEEEYEIVN